MLGNSISQDGWPRCGEIDIMEHINNTTEIVGTMHWDNSGHASWGDTTPCNVTDYHVYSIEWDANAIRWFLDGNLYHEGNIANNINSTDEFHFPFFIILNLAVGGNWPGNPNTSTPFPDTMCVDYVRVYQVSAGTSSGEIERIPDQFALHQNYPNPFNPTTVISYQLPVTSEVRLAVYDVLGRQVAMLVGEVKQPGTHAVQWGDRGMVGGVYFCRLRAGRFVDVKKMIVVR
jgi:beta-glucanase (GH16 family)